MSWCPICKVEYREGFSTCSDCRVQLIESLPEEQAKQSDESAKCEPSVYLTTANDVANANVIESLLSAYNIPITKVFKEAGGYLTIYMGNTCYGIDIYVPSSAIQEAREILKPGACENEDKSLSQEIPDDETKQNIKYKQKRRIRAWIVLILFVPGLLAVLVSAVIALLNYLK